MLRGCWAGWRRGGGVESRLLILGRSHITNLYSSLYHHHIAFNVQYIYGRGVRSDFMVSVSSSRRCIGCT